MCLFDAAAVDYLVDYLLKPFDCGRFQTALERVRRRLAETAGRPNAGELRNAARGPGQYVHRIVVKDGTRVHIIPAGQLDYAEAQDDYVALHSCGKTYLKQQTISSLEAGLDPMHFVRVHRSFLLNLNRISKIEPYTKDTRLAILVDGSQVPVSRAGYVRLKQLMDGA